MMISIRFEIEGSDSDQKNNILHNAPTQWHCSQQMNGIFLQS